MTLDILYNFLQRTVGTFVYWITILKIIFFEAKNKVIRARYVLSRMKNRAVQTRLSSSSIPVGRREENVVERARLIARARTREAIG